MSSSNKHGAFYIITNKTSILKSQFKLGKVRTSKQTLYKKYNRNLAEPIIIRYYPCYDCILEEKLIFQNYDKQRDSQELASYKQPNTFIFHYVEFIYLLQQLDDYFYRQCDSLYRDGTKPYDPNYVINLNDTRFSEKTQQENQIMYKKYMAIKNKDGDCMEDD